MAVEQGAEELARELQAARQRAVAQNSTYRVLFDRGGKAYYILSEDAFAPSRCIQLPPGVEWEKLSTNPLVFYGTGRCPVEGLIPWYTRFGTGLRLWLPPIPAACG